MTRYDTYAVLLHALGAGLLFFLFGWSADHPAYYGFQFVGGQSGFGTGRMEPAPAPTLPQGASGSPSKESPLQKTDDLSRVAVASKKNQKNSPPPKHQAKKEGVKGGRGESALGRGDFQGSTSGPVGGVGTSLEIGGFGPGGGGAGPSFPFKWYGELVYKRLWESWDRTDAGTLECKVVFKILRNGKVEGVKIKTSSGDALFDMTAKRAVLTAAPFPELPEGFKESSLPILVRFRLQ